MDKKSIRWDIIAIFIALLAFLFGDNIYERITGRSIFNASPTLTSPEVTNNAPFTTNTNSNPTSIDSLDDAARAEGT